MELIKSCLPLLAILAGGFICAAAFLYDLMFAGIPYQDPTAELQLSYEHQSTIASVFYRVGVLLVLTFVVAHLIRLISARSGD